MRRGWALTLACCMLLLLATVIQTAHGWMTEDIDLVSMDPNANVTAICGANTGWRSGDNAGAAVLCADLDGDGFDDIILSAPYAAPEFDRRTDSGLVYVIYGGKPMGPVFGLGGADLTLCGPSPQMLLGQSLGAGDVNADGIKDLIVGAPGYSTPDRQSCGAVIVVLGSETRLTGIREVFKTAAMNATGSSPYSQLGTSVAAGDINGDGIDDLLAGATELAPQGMGLRGPGEVQVAFGRSTFDRTTAHFNLNISGQSSGEGLGSSLACDDLNGDGKDDIIAGAPYFTPYLVDPEIGRAYAVFGSTNMTGNVSVSKAELTITGTEPGGRLGWSVLPIDLDLDSKPELAISAPFAGGGGKESGIVSIFDHDILSEGISPNWAKWTLQGAKPGSHIGKAMAEVQMKGGSYLAIGAPESIGSRPDGASAGELHLIPCAENLTAGSKGVTSLASMTVYGAGDGDLLGSSVASGSALDGTEGGLMIGAPGADGTDGEGADCGVAYVLWPEPRPTPADPDDQEGGDITLPATNDWKDWVIVGVASVTFFCLVILGLFLLHRSKKKPE